MNNDLLQRIADGLVSPRFPRSSAYHSEWIMASVSGGSNSLWLTEWLTEAMDLRPGMRVLDRAAAGQRHRSSSAASSGCKSGPPISGSALLRTSNGVRDAGVEDGVFPIRADARSLPFAEGFFDAIVSIESFMYYGTDDVYLNYLARFVKPAGAVGIALVGVLSEIGDPVPAHLSEWWAVDLPYSLHSAGWWRRHWEQTGIVDIAVADSLPDGWRFWRDWTKLVAPENEKEIPGARNRRRPPLRLRSSHRSPSERDATVRSAHVCAHAIHEKAAAS